MDVDRFKAINDEHGHLAGDYVLKHLAGILKGCLRSEDVLARYGGEEFALLLPEIDGQGARAVAEKLRTRTEAETFTFDSRTIQVTLSLGVSTLASPDQAPADLVDAADRKLYEAKAAGRNVTRA
jgi:diguanylate cyclase (GGDEF)-like protein